MRAPIARESGMIVCSCNVLTDVDIRASIATLNGPRRVCEVYASLGCTAKCGGCAGTICALISEAEGRDFGAEQIKQGGEPRGELTHAAAKVIDTLNRALKRELSAMPRAFGRSSHPSMHRWN
jgi:bacterioferritin-associated ferredoxin